MEKDKMITFVYDESFDSFDIWKILGENGPIRFVHGNEYSASFGNKTYFLIFGVFTTKDRLWLPINMDMSLQGWGCDIKYADIMELLNPDKKWISLYPLQLSI